MKRVFLILPLLSLLVLAGCAGARTFGSDLRALEGKPINDAAIMLGGKHTGEYMNGDAIVYVWQRREAESIFGSSVTMGYGLGSPMNDGSAFILSGLEYHSCVIRATTLDNIIRKITYEGDPGGCETIYGYRRGRLTPKANG